MHLIDATNAEAYLRESGRLAAGERVTVRELAGGVSNIVLLVAFAGGERPSFVLKQAREQLRVTQPWFCSPERIWREVAVLRECETLSLGSVAEYRLGVPQVLFEDRSNYAFTMTAAPAEAVTWKQRLMASDVDLDVAAACGTLMGTLHGRTWRDSAVQERFGSREYFDNLRIDPYYRQIARVHPVLQPAIDGVIDSLAAHPRCLVHGDFSPKNLLVSDGRLMLIDCEVGHYGDPAFDLGFFLSHLKLKQLHFRDGAFEDATNTFWRSYHATMEPTVGAAQYLELEKRTATHTACCMLARIDGKSPVDYLTPDERRVTRENMLRQLTSETLNA